MNKREELQAQARSILKAASTEILVESLAQLCSMWPADAMPFEARMSHYWLCEELEERNPAAKEFMDRWSEDLDPASKQRYGLALIAAVMLVN